jgi:hypothetical protein
MTRIVDCHLPCPPPTELILYDLPCPLRVSLGLPQQNLSIPHDFLFADLSLFAVLSQPR